MNTSKPMNAEEALKNWETEQHSDWYAVDCLICSDGKKPGRINRLMVTTDKARAQEVAARRAAGYDLAYGEPGEIGQMNFYRCTMISAAVAHDYLAGCLVDGESSELLPLSEAAALAGISRQSMHGRIKRGSIPAELVGTEWYVSVASIMLYGQD